MTKPAGVFVHERAICESLEIGAGTRIWAFAHVLPAAKLGTNCNICDGVFIENDVIVGNDVTVKCGVQLWDGVRLGDRVFIGPNATFTNDKFPRSKQYQEAVLETVVGDDASIGANATILPGIRIGRSAMIGAGAVVTKDVPAHAIVAGNPARIVKYVADRNDCPPLSGSGHEPAPKLGVGDCSIQHLPTFSDARGSLTAIEHGTDLPFPPRRTFIIFGVGDGQARGEHAHHQCSQFMLALTGTVRVVIDDANTRQDVLLGSPTKGLYVPPMIWASLYQFSPGTVVQVFASHPYDGDDYIRDYEHFRALAHIPTRL